MDAQLVVDALCNAGFDPEWKRVETESDFLAALRDPPDIILCDYALPMFDGLQALKLLRGSGSNVPLIIVSGTIGEETAVATMKHGAADYLLLKKHRLARLGSAVSHVLEQSRSRRQHQQAEEALRQSEARFAKAFRSNPAAMCITTIKDGRFIEVNERYEDLSGYSRRELIGRTAVELAFWNDPAEGALLVERLRNHSFVRDHETQFRRQSGRVLDVLISMELIEFPGEQEPVLISMFADVTGQKALETRLLRAQRMESIGTLASGVAHDLNNVLGQIMMSVSLLRRDMAAEQREEFISTIERSAERGAEIVKQVLTFGRGVEGERKPLSVDVLVNELIKMLGGTFPKHIAIENSIGAGIWPVIGDATQLHQVLLNLCINARDAMPDGGRLQLQAANVDFGASHASLLPEAKPGPYVLLEVSDTGCGIPPDIADRIFDPFFTTKEMGEGTGLGLSTAHGIVKSHDGVIRVTAPLGKGTTFQVYLPASPDREVPADAIRVEIPKGNDEVVLVVDDEAGVRDAVRLILESAGYRVLLAADGAEALAMFAQNIGSIAAVLTDLTLPYLDGGALIRVLRNMGRGLPIIVSTGLGESGLAKLKAMGGATVLHKPYGSDMLLRTLHGALHPTAPP